MNDRILQENLWRAVCILCHWVIYSEHHKLIAGSHVVHEDSPYRVYVRHKDCVRTLLYNFLHVTMPLSCSHVVLHSIVSDSADQSLPAPAMYMCHNDSNRM